MDRPVSTSVRCMSRRDLPSISWAGQRDKSSSLEQTPAKALGWRKSPGLGTYLFLESRCLLREAGLCEIFYHIHHCPFYGVSWLLFTPRTVLKQREPVSSDAPLVLPHDPRHHPPVSKIPTYGQPKGVPSAPGRAGFPGGKGTGDGESGPLAAETRKEKASVCGFVLGLGFSSGIFPYPEESYLIPLPYSRLPWKTPGGCHFLVLAPALHPGPGGVHRVSTP